MHKLPVGLENSVDTNEKIKQQLLWLQFIRAEKEEEVKMLAARMPEIQEAYGVLKKLSEDEQVRLLYESREKAIIDEQARLYGAHEEGIKENKIETARRFLAMGLSVEMVAQGTELTEKEVQDLQKQVNTSNLETSTRKASRSRKNSVPA